MSTESNKSIVRNWVDAAWNRGDFSLASELYLPTYVLHFGSMPDTQGAEGLVGFIGLYHNAMPDFHMQLEDMVAEGDKVVWRITATGTQTGEFLGIPPSSRPVRVMATITSRFESGKWVEDWVNNDDLGLFQQIGVIPMLGAATVA